MKKFLSLLLVILMVASLLPVGVITIFAEGEGTETEDDVWALPETLPGLLVPMWDHNFGVQKPWRDIMQNDGSLLGGMAASTVGATYRLETIVDYTKLEHDDLILVNGDGEPGDPESYTVDENGLRNTDQNYPIASLVNELENGYGWMGAAGIMMKIAGTGGGGAGKAADGTTVPAGIGGNSQLGQGFHIFLTVKVKRKDLDPPEIEEEVEETEETETVDGEGTTETAEPETETTTEGGEVVEPVEEEPIYEYIIFKGCPLNSKAHPSYFYAYDSMAIQYYQNGVWVKGKDGRTGYTFPEKSWRVEAVYSTNGRVLPNFKGYMYFPLESFYCYGAAAHGWSMNHDDAEAAGLDNIGSAGDWMSFADAMTQLEDPEIVNISFNGAWTAGANLYEFDWVYADTAYDNSITEKPDDAITVDSTVNATAGDNGFTVTDISTPAILNANFALGGSNGLRFHVDTTAAEGPVTMQLAMNSPLKQCETQYATGTLLVSESEEYLTVTSEDTVKSVLKGGDSVLYYFEDGAAKPIFLDKISDLSGVFTLPENYNGEIYVPLAGWYSQVTDKVYIPATTSLILDFDQIIIDQKTAGAVTYGDFRVVRGDTYFVGAYPSIGNDISVSFYAKVEGEPDLVDAKLVYAGSTVVGEKKSVTKVTNEDDPFYGMYKITLSGIAFDHINDPISATLVINNVPTSVAVSNYSVRKYCENMLANPDASAELKTLLVDLLNYGAAVQTIRGTAVDNLVNSTLTDDQKALAGTKDIAEETAVSKTSGDPSDLYEWQGVSPVFNLNHLAIQLTFSGDEYIGWNQFFTLNDRPAEYDLTANAGINRRGYVVSIFNNITPAEFSKTVFVRMAEFEDEFGDTFETSMNAALAAAAKTEQDEATMNAIVTLYRLGASTEAYLASIEE